MAGNFQGHLAFALVKTSISDKGKDILFHETVTVKSPLPMTRTVLFSTYQVSCLISILLCTNCLLRNPAIYCAYVWLSPELLTTSNFL